MFVNLSGESAVEGKNHEHLFVTVHITELETDGARAGTSCRPKSYLK